MKWSRGWSVGVILLAALSLTGAVAAQPGPKDEWLELRSPNFLLYTNGPERKAREIADGLEHLRQIIAYIGTDIDSIRQVPITFIVFRNEKSFLPYMRVPPTRGIVRSWESFYGVGRDYVLLDGSKPPSDVLPWAYSAYARYLIGIRYRDYPYWLRRGLGEFYGATEIDARRHVRIGVPVKKHVETMRKRSMQPLEQFFRTAYDSEYLDNPDRLRIFNAQSWLIAHYLMTSGGDGSNRGPDFFRALQQGRSPEEAIRSVFGMDLDGFERFLVSYVRQPTLPVFALDGDAILTDLDLEATPLDNLEASYQLGYYLVVAHDPPPIALAEAHLEPVVEAEGPRYADALAVLAELHRRTGRQELAGTQFADAMAEEPRDATSYMFYAEYLEASAASNADPIPVLERAVEIEPGFGAAWSELGKAYAETSGHSEEAAAALEHALELLPNRPDLAYDLAMTHLDDGDLPGARRVVDRYLREAPRYRDPAIEAINRRELTDASRRASTAGDLDSAIASYREALAQATDPGIRAQMESELRRLEQIQRTQERGHVYNRAVALANDGHYQEALDLLHDLLPEIEDISLKTATTNLITQLEDYLNR